MNIQDMSKVSWKIRILLIMKGKMSKVASKKAILLIEGGR